MALALALLATFLWTGFLASRGLANEWIGAGGLLLVLLVLGTYVAAAVVVLLRRPADPVNRALFPFLTLLGAVTAGRIADRTTETRDLADRVAFAGSFALYAVLMGWVVVTVLAFFPVRRVPSPGRAFVVATLVCLVPAGAYLAEWIRAGALRPLGGGWPRALAIATLAVDLFVFVYYLSLTFLARREDVRRRARVVLVGVLVDIGGYIFLRDIPMVAGLPPTASVEVTSALSLVFPVAMLVAATRFRLFEVDRLIRRSAAYALTSLVLVALLLAAVPLLTATLFAVMPAEQGTLTTAVVTVVLFLLFDPLRRRAQRALDRRLSVGPADPGRLVAEIVSDLKDAGDAVSAEVVHRLSGALHPARQAFWTFAGEPGARARPVTGGSLFELPAIDRAMLMPHAAPPGEEEPVWTLTADGGDPPFEEGPLADSLRGAGFAVAAPLFSKAGEPVGLLALGRKRNGEPYLPEELTLVEAVAGHAALALEREDLARQLEEDRRVRDKVLGHLTAGGGGTLYECDLCGRVAGEDEVLCPNDGHALQMTQAVPRLLAGRYRLDRRLGEGGMGTVYAATDVPGARDVAVKLIRADQLKDGSAIARFRREARLTGRLGHPNAIGVFDYGELPGGGAFLVMELLTGGSLRAELGRRAPLPFPEAAWVLDKTLDVLAAAHAAGLVHRDVKPDNLFVTRGPAGRPVLKLLDFGLARETRVEHPSDPGTSISSVDVLVGTPGYIAPEVVRGETATHASDLWSVAATGFELLTGVRVRIENESIPVKRLADEIADVITGASPDVPLAYARALGTALAVDPDDRPVSAIALRRILTRAARGRVQPEAELSFEVLGEAARPY